MSGDAAHVKSAADANGSQEASVDEDDTSGDVSLTSALSTTYDDLELRAGEHVMYDGEPKVWGGVYWRYVHLMAYYYPESPNDATRQATFQSLDAWRFTLPCSNCRDGFRSIWERFPLRNYLSSRALFIEWTILVHNAVNEEQGLAELDFQTYMNKLVGSEAVIVASSDDDKESDDSDDVANVASDGDDDDDDGEAESDVRRTDGVDVVADRKKAVKSAPTLGVGRKRGGRLEMHRDSNGRGRSGRGDLSNHRSTGVPKASVVFGRPESNRSTRRQQVDAAMRKAQMQFRARAQQKARNGKQRAPYDPTQRYQSGASLSRQRFDNSGRGGRGGGRHTNANKRLQFKVAPPRDCPNCNRRVLAPSIF